MDEVSNAELKLLKQATKSNIKYFYNNDLKLCELLCKKGYLNEILVENNESSFTVTYGLTNKGTIYVECKNKEKFEFIVSRIVIPLGFFLLGAISTNFDKIYNFVSKVIPNH